MSNAHLEKHQFYDCDLLKYSLFVHAVKHSVEDKSASQFVPEAKNTNSQSRKR